MSERGNTRRARRKTADPPAAAEARPLAGVDGGLVLPAAVLTSIGLLMVYSTTSALELARPLPQLFLRQLAAVLIGAIVVAGVARVPLRAWRVAALPLWALAMAFLVWTAIDGVRVNGAQRWLSLPGVGTSFQPGELAKWASLLAAAQVLAAGTGRVGPTRRAVLVCLVIALVPTLLLVAQPDFGNAVLLALLVAILCFVAGTPLRAFALPGVAALGAAAAYVATHSYALDRLRGFSDPWGTAQGAGFQLVQSFVAFGRGGLLGVGIGDGRQKLFYLPEAHTDFILSVVAEELGLIGVLLVIGAFAALLVAGTRIARHAGDRFAMILAIGMTSLLVIPAIVNAAVVTGVLPTKGMSLPFLSYGRSGLLMSFAALGLLVAIARQSPGAPSRPTRRLFQVAR